MDIYLNGIDVGGGYVGSSNLPMGAFSTEVAKIGYRDTNDTPIHFQGMIDELRIFNISLSQDQVRQNMCRKLSGNETGLVGYWNFDETSGSTVYDESSNHFSGALMNGPQRIFSGAPIGDDSKYLYSANWSGTTLSMTDGNDQVSASNIQGNPEGLQIYEVKKLPSQTTGLNLSNVSQPYFGVFAASLDNDNKFDVTYIFQNSNSCGLFSRANNSISTWTSANNPTTNILQQTEVIKIAGVSFDLGPDQILCNQTSATLSTGLSDPNLTFTWSNGMNTPSVNVSQSGEYEVSVYGECGTVKDSVDVLFEKTPPAVSLGHDQTLCLFKPITLNAVSNPDEYQIIWQDNSTGNSIEVKDFGTYWVTVKNNCGVSSDTIHFTRAELDISKLPNVITPNGDVNNEFYKVPSEFVGEFNLEIFNRWGRKVFQANGYKNDWNGEDLDSGVYYLMLTGGCIDRFKDTLTILR